MIPSDELALLLFVFVFMPSGGELAYETSTLEFIGTSQFFIFRSNVPEVVVIGKPLATFGPKEVIC